jgi:anti-sigma regulatory factor (Ser/Thr protein kinase)
VTGKLRLRLKAERESLGCLGEAIEEFGLDQDWSPKLLFQTQLALEELVTNVIEHGFRKRGHSLEVVISSSPDSVMIELTDDSWPFNPLSDAPEPNVDGVLEDRPIGGLGVHLARTFMDESRYAREDGKNRLTLTKRRDE